jgi:tRNA(Ile)-lysidine synthase
VDAENFQRIVTGSVERHGMDLSRPLALVSGGPDSTALLRALVGIGARPFVLHVDHGLRGEESRADAEFVRGLCDGLGLECEVHEPALEAGSGLQERARRKRYELAGELAESMGASCIATGHTADDVAETVLMNLARGAGARGLAGIPPVRGEIVRPLIEFRRTDILGYLDSLGQGYRTDPTNATGKYTRNRVRNEVLPVLEELYPGAGANVARASGILRDDLEVLEELGTRAVRSRSDELLIPGSGELRYALRRYAVRYAHSRLAPESPPLGLDAVETVLALGGKGKESGGTLDLPSGIVAASRQSGEVALYERRPEPGAESVEVVAGEFEISGSRVQVRKIPAPASLPADASRPDVAYLDAAFGPYRLRTAREGDVVRPLGLGGSKKVLRSMMDRKVPRDLRRRTPVVVDSRERVAWVAGGELGEEFPLGAGSRWALRLEALDYSAEPDELKNRPEI